MPPKRLSPIYNLCHPRGKQQTGIQWLPPYRPRPKAEQHVCDVCGEGKQGQEPKRPPQQRSSRSQGHQHPVCTGRTGVRRLRTGSTPWTRGGRKNSGSRWVRRTPGVPTVTSEVARQLVAATATIQRIGTAAMTHLATDHAVWWWTTVPYVTVKASDSHFTRNILSYRDPQLTIPIAQAWELRVL